MLGLFEADVEGSVFGNELFAVCICIRLAGSLARQGMRLSVSLGFEPFPFFLMYFDLGIGKIS